MCQYAVTGRSRVRLNPELASYEQQQVFDTIDASPVCHMAASDGQSPYLQTSVHWRIGNKVYCHGAVKNKMLQLLHKGAEACLSFSSFDGYVLPRSGFNHAVLYSSVIAYSRARTVVSSEEKMQLLEAYIESIEPGRWQQIRQPSREELLMTGIVEFELEEVSAKILPAELAKEILPGGSLEAEEDKNYSPWTGVIPYRLQALPPITAESYTNS